MNYFRKIKLTRAVPGLERTKHQVKKNRAIIRDRIESIEKEKIEVTRQIGSLMRKLKDQDL